MFDILTVDDWIDGLTVPSFVDPVIKEIQLINLQLITDFTM